MATEPALAGLRLSELLARARESGAAQQLLDECMDSTDPRAAVLAILARSSGRAATVPAQLFDAAVVGEAALPPEGWLEPFAFEGYAAFPAVLSHTASEALVAELLAL